MRFFSKVPNGKQLPSCKKSDQNLKKNQSHDTFYRDLNSVKFYLLSNY